MIGVAVLLWIAAAVYGLRSAAHAVIGSPGVALVTGWVALGLAFAAVTVTP